MDVNHDNRNLTRRQEYMKFYIVDCFAEEKYQGNELLVVMADRPVSDEEQQKIAREINFSETTFILSGKQDNGGYDVRIWTPNVGEVPFAGHPTLGTAYIIHKVLEKGSSTEIKLNLKAGQIPVKVTEDGLIMRQNQPEFGAEIDRNIIADIFGIEVDDIREDLPVEWVSTGLEAVIIPLKHRDTLRKLACDKEKFNAYVKKYPTCYCNHLFFVDMQNRSFAARCLMEDFVEDPATGSANGDLAGYFMKHDYFNSKDVFYTVVQGEDMDRKSVLHIHAVLNEGVYTIEVGGNVYIVASGEWE